MLASLAHFVYRRRRAVVAVWILLTAFGAFSAQRVSERWFESFSIPGYDAYETNQKTLRLYGSGEQAPLVAVFRSEGDVTKIAGVRSAIAAAARANRGARVSSWYSTHDTAYVSSDRHTTFAEIYPTGMPGFEFGTFIADTRAALRRSTPAGVTANLTGRDALQEEASHGGGGPSLITEALVSGAGALVILFFVFGTLPAVLMPIAVAIGAILNTFTLVWALTYLTDVSIIVQFLIAIIGLGVAIDYALLMIFRFREELAAGRDTESALVETMTHAGHSVIVSGSTVAVGLVSMILLPLPFIRSIGIGGMLIPAVSVVAAITLLPALLGMLGARINRVRMLPKRLVAGSGDGFWGRWSDLVVRRPVPVALAGLVITGLLVYCGVQLNPSEARVADIPAKGDAAAGRDALVRAGISPGVLKPLVVLARERSAGEVTRRLTDVEGIAGAAAPPDWRRDGYALVEAFPTTDGASDETRATIARVKETLPAGASLGGLAPEERDFVRAVYGNFPYVLAFVVLLTFVLLTRAFRSLVLPIKAVLLNLASLAAAFGIIVFIFQWGHGSEALWDVRATDSIIPWIPLMIFAFLYGLSMDYEVFMLTRMRETYDETGSTTRAIASGLARTGKLVTSAALILMFAFLVLSSSPGFEIKEFAIGLAAGIIFDATVIRALLVPALMRLLGEWNWFLPHWTRRALRLPPAQPDVG